ncbi:Retrovirus-related Pol polyprotein from transposon 17.6 [Thelohanellus kitauei]|uniref:Retrovirus-related Pol polyprotein from transposon 17.6 n=1 Tax=Thelohanellus kitauei TaxID=669202 RepID=A0A0C2ITZ7_THEKT|nr:Retrovirus-related Pol polyprotein from transposon 17.6 [Thelohanellus kitauei]
MDSKNILVYIDYIILFSKSKEDHIRLIKKTFEAFKNAGLKINPKNCSFFRSEITFLGFVISPNGIATVPNKIETVKSWKCPMNQKELQRFIGFCGHYRQYVKNFAKNGKHTTGVVKGGCGSEMVYPTSASL